MRRINTSILAVGLLACFLTFTLYRKQSLIENLQIERSKLADQIHSLESELARQSAEIATLTGELDDAKYGPYEQVSRNDLPGPLQVLGVKLFRDRYGNVSKAKVPDTTNFGEVASALQQYSTLRIVSFVPGPNLDRTADWQSAEYRETFAAATTKPIFRTFSLSSEHRDRAVSVFKEKLNDVKVELSPASF